MAKSDSAIEAAIVRADQLLAQKKETQAEIQQARDFLNQAKTLGILTPEQEQWVTENLPRRSRNAAPVGEE